MKTKRTEEQALAQKLRNCYQFERNRLHQHRDRKQYRIPPCWDIGRTTGPETKKVSTWHKLVRFCRRQEIDPVKYIQWTLDFGQVLLDRPPEPNHLLELKRMEIYKEEIPKIIKQIQIRWMCQTNATRARYISYLNAGKTNAEDAWALVLGANCNEVSPLLSWAIAKAIEPHLDRFRKIADFFGHKALLQYQYHADAYNRTWVKIYCKQDFAERAIELYDEIISKQP